MFEKKGGKELGGQVTNKPHTPAVQSPLSRDKW